MSVNDQLPWQFWNTCLESECNTDSVCAHEASEKEIRVASKFGGNGIRGK
jgi:hypothetical protein